MKYLLILIQLLISSCAFALSCPNGNGLLYKGDLLDDVIKACGEPLTRNSVTRTLYSLQEWTYYIKHLYDAGYSQLNVSFKNGYVVRIHIEDHFWTIICRQVVIQYGAVNTVQTGCNNAYDVPFTNLCGLNFGTGATTQAVEYICGLPVVQTNKDYTITVTELIYGKDVLQTIIFQDGKLLDWK